MACGGGNTQNVTVTVLPASATLDAGRTLQFLATVTGASDNSVVWSATCGTISSSGLYTAPTSPATCIVRATSHANTDKYATASVTVTQPLSVSIFPNSITLYTMQTQKFAIVVSGTVDQAVAWSANCGAISQDGLYTAPPRQTTCTVVAISHADATKSASATITITASPLAGNFVWLKFYAPQNGTASGKAVAVTANGTIVAGIDSVYENAADPVATLAFYVSSGTQQSVWSNDIPSSITSMTYDPGTDVVAAAGYTGGAQTSGARAGMLLLASANPPGILLNKTFQLEGMRTEIRAVLIGSDEIFLAVNSDFQQCGLAQGNCSGDWIVVTDRQGAILRKFAVGNAAAITLGPTSITGLTLAAGSLFVTGDLLSGSPIPPQGSYLEVWSLDGRLMSTSVPVNSFAAGALPVLDGPGNLYVAGTTFMSAGLWRPERESIYVGKTDPNTLVQTSEFFWDRISYPSLTITNGVTPLNPGGLTVVGSVMLQSNWTAGAVSLDPDLNVLWRQQFDNLPTGTASSWNAVAYDTDGQVLLVGTGSTGTISPAAVIGRFCTPAP